MSKAHWALGHLYELAGRYVDLCDDEGEAEVTDARAVLLALIGEVERTDAVLARWNERAAYTIENHSPRLASVRGIYRDCANELERAKRGTK